MCRFMFTAVCRCAQDMFTGDRRWAAKKRKLLDKVGQPVAGLCMCVLGIGSEGRNRKLLDRVWGLRHSAGMLKC